jgi:hypothetical protein
MSKYDDLVFLSILFFRLSYLFISLFIIYFKQKFLVLPDCVLI